MTFTTLTFAIFLPLVFGLYWSLASRGAQNTLIVVCSLVFYGWWDWRFCALMVGSTLVDYAAGLVISRSQRPSTRHRALAASIFVCLGLLCFFKYFNFFALNFSSAIAAFGWQADPITLHVILPIGISFYTFQSMSYTIEVYRGRLEPCTSLRDYLAFVTFFPQLVAGPIERAAHLLGQFQRDRVFSAPAAADGCRQALWGLFKKFVIADCAAPLVNVAFEHPEAYDGGRLALAAVFFAFQIYCDFSGYSDIAIGVARLFGIDIMRNFAYPYFSRDVGEFWRRWHISLSTWFRDYLFIPLGGSRGSRWLRVCAILATFTLSGLWHGAGWNYIGWGALNGAAVVPSSLSTGHTRRTVDDVPGGDGCLPSLRDLLRMSATFTFVCVTWVFFRALSVEDAIRYLSRIVTDPHMGTRALYSPFSVGEMALGAMIPIFVGIEWIQRRRAHALDLARCAWPARWMFYCAIFWAIFVLTPGEPMSFIYFQF